MTSPRYYFNTSPSTRGFERVTRVQHKGNISIPAPPRGASEEWSIPMFNKKFQYQPLHEGLRIGTIVTRTQSYFNTSPSTRGFADKSVDRATHDISIPAPPRGASECHGDKSQSRDISIPAPPRGASTIDHPPLMVAEISIPAPPRGASEWPYTQLTDPSISIPAPPRGASDQAVRHVDRTPISIPAPPRGASKKPINDRIFCIFQYQPLHEGLPTTRMI